MLLIVSDTRDIGIAEVARELVWSSPECQVKVVSTAELSLARWTHRISSSGVAVTILTLRDGTRIDDSSDLRVAYLASTSPMPRFVQSSSVDRDYATSEFRASMVSWLRGLGSRVVNASSGAEPNGPPWSPGQWLVEAAAAGLPVASTAYATRARLASGWHGTPESHLLPAFPATTAAGTALVAGDHIAGPLGTEFGSACRQLGERSGCGVFYLGLAAEPGRITVVSASPCGSPSTPEQVSALARFLAEWSVQR